MTPDIQMPKQNLLWYLTESTPAHTSVSNINSKYDSKIANNYQWEQMCAFLYCSFIHGIVYIHGNMHDLHFYYRE